MGSLKLFVKAVRKAKTIADERTVIRKESAAIRTSFRDPNLDQTTRRVDISKLLYLYILGEKTHFGQVECLKLLVLPRFADKRLGYLAAMLLLDENQEVLTLLTNSLDNDMKHHNKFIAALALNCLGNLASPELARDLYANVEEILKLSNSVYLKKRACVVAAKLTEKEPDLGDVFAPMIPTLLEDKSPLILSGTCHMIQAVYNYCPSFQPDMVKLIPKLIAHFKRIISTGYLPDYDVNGVTDPFLKVTLLTTLRTLAVNANCTADDQEQLNDILTQVVSNHDSGKNAAHAVLYECVKTIFAVNSDQSLRVLGVNILGKFLPIKDNNTRYVALEMLLTVIDHEPLAVQRNRATIISCLADGDISIRRRALELAFAIINEQNIRVLLREILSFLGSCPDVELKPYITSQLTICAAKYAPNEKWHFDTLTRMLKLSDNHVTPDILSSILALIMRCQDAELKKHVISNLVQAGLEDPAQYGLALVTVWSVGEYADLILGSNIEIDGQPVAVDENLLLHLFDLFSNNPNYSEQESTQILLYMLTAALKLSAKMHTASAIEQLRAFINLKSTDNNLEVQTRALEYKQLFMQHESSKQGLLARMPAPPIKEREGLSLQGKAKVAPPSASTSHSTTEDLLNLLDDDVPSQPQSATQQNNNDLLSDIFGGLSTKDTKNTNTMPATQDLSSNGIEGFKNSHLRVAFIPKQFGNGEATADVEITAVDHGVSIDRVQILIAVPKSQKLTITTTSGSDSLVTSNVIRQSLKVVGAAGSKLKLRVKLKYNANQSEHTDQFDFAKFTSTL
ncbi:hypothetical protein PUMCH_004135 [Australozyma saopauloensis]|uniref:AP-1 complex subunit gamma n=1 Tax=Australozyma saopauloensis TaxID=291208 RepID=A0AAX4HE07_9ASCO|nr:hypothetical protein PUMCH_004135 [[Candida] saopauloensis]